MNKRDLGEWEEEATEGGIQTKFRAKAQRW